MSWYPLGRPVGTTIYPGMQVTSVFIKQFVLPKWSINDICCLVPAWFGSLATASTAALCFECASGQQNPCLGDDSVETIAWNHYRNFLDSIESDDSDGVGDVDELVELLEILEPFLEKTKANNSASSRTNDARFHTIGSLLPVLASVAHYHLAAVGIDEAIETKQVDEKGAKHESIEQHLQQSLRHFMMNAATHSIQGNYERMRAEAPLTEIVMHYEMAALSATDMRETALKLLRNDCIQDEVKEWIELLLLDAVAGVEYVGRDDKDETDEESNNDNSTKETGQQDLSFSSSAVESTSRFMAAMLLSALQQHTDAMAHLKESDLTHRLHPNVWQSDKASVLSEVPPRNEPSCFAQPVLPPTLHQRLCRFLASDAPYWKESDYAHRGYYSYYFDIQH